MSKPDHWCQPSVKHQHSACIFTSLHRHYNLIFPEITSLLNKTDLCFNRSPLCQLELQGEVTGKKLMHPKFSSREILVSPVSEERRERWGWKEIRNHLNILHFAIISPAAVHSAATPVKLSGAEQKDAAVKTMKVTLKWKMLQSWGVEMSQIQGSRVSPCIANSQALTLLLNCKMPCFSSQTNNELERTWWRFTEFYLNYQPF